jgi:hypothetical protein
MISPCLLRRSPSVCSTHIGSPACARCRHCTVCSVTRMREWCGWCGAQKNALWSVRPRAIGLVRPQAAAGARSVLRGLAHLPGTGGTPRLVPKLRTREARAAGVSDRQCAAHQALCLPGRPALSQRYHQGGSRRAAPGLAQRQGAGKAVHARPARSRGYPCAQGDRHRRDLGAQAPHLPYRGQRSDSTSGDLVRRRGSLRGEHERVLRLVGREEMPGDTSGGHGHVEAVSYCHRTARPPMLPSCSTSSTSYATWAKRSTRSERANTPG